jgi:hypothetical protein
MTKMKMSWINRFFVVTLHVLINSVFMEELDKFIVVFIYDILVSSKSMEGHEEHV